MDEAVWDIGYLVASILFIMGLKKSSRIDVFHRTIFVGDIN